MVQLLRRDKEVPRCRKGYAWSPSGLPTPESRGGLTEVRMCNGESNVDTLLKLVVTRNKSGVSGLLLGPPSDSFLGTHGSRLSSGLGPRSLKQG